MPEPKTKYNLYLRILHWLMAFLIISLTAIGYGMTEFTEQSSLLRRNLYDLHKSLGILVALLIINRIIVRLITKSPSYSPAISRVNIILAKLLHFSMYILMISVAFSGFLMCYLSKRDLLFFGYKIPKFLNNNIDLAGILHEFHVILPYVLLGCFVLHILATIKHIYVDRDNIFQRIAIQISCKK
jgi:cytochrome b561